jgi:hypothetical protein
MKITKPGIYPNLTAAQYHSDPCPSPSLSQSLAKIIIDKSPLHAWCAHPRLNPDWRADDPTKFDLGNAAHTMLLGRGKTLAVLDEEFVDWRTKAAKEARIAAQAAGQLAVLSKSAAKATRMVTAAREQLELRGLAHLFVEGQGEIVTAWTEGDIWLRQMIDWLTPDARTVVDYKTTQESAAPQAVGRKMFSDGWPVQAAMAERGLDALDPQSAGRRQYLFVVQEAEPPYQINVVAISEAVLTMGRKRLDMAVDIWRDCMAANIWPGYPLDVLTPELPGWAEAQWLDREITHDANKRLNPEVMMAG